MIAQRKIRAFEKSTIIFLASLLVSPETLIQVFTNGKIYMEVAWGIWFLWYVPLRYLTKYHYDYESIQLALLFGLSKIVLVSPETLIQVLTIKSFLVG